MTLRLGPPGARVAVEVVPDSGGPRWIDGADPIDAWVAGCAALNPWRTYGGCDGRAEEALEADGVALRRTQGCVEGAIDGVSVRVRTQDPLLSWLRAGEWVARVRGRSPAVQEALAGPFFGGPTAPFALVAHHRFDGPCLEVGAPRREEAGWVLPYRAAPFVEGPRGWPAPTELDAWFLAPQLSAMFLWATWHAPPDPSRPMEAAAAAPGPLGTPSEVSWTDPLLERPVDGRVMRIGREEPVGDGVHAVWARFPDGVRRAVYGEPGQPLFIALSVWAPAPTA